MNIDDIDAINARLAARHGPVSKGGLLPSMAPEPRGLRAGASVIAAEQERPCPVCARGYREDCRRCLGEGRVVDVPVSPPALPEWTEEPVEREVLRVLSWHRVACAESRARSVAAHVTDLCSRADPLGVLTCLCGQRAVADDVVCAVAAALRGAAREQRSHRYGRDAERCEQAARRLDGMADAIEAAALREMRRAG